MRDFLYHIYAYTNRNKYVSISVALVFLFVFGFFASKISFQENINQLIPSNNQSDTTTKVLEQVNFADKIAIVITAKNIGNKDSLTAYAEDFIKSIEKDYKPYIGKIQGKVEDKNIQETFEFVYKNLPLFLDQSDYALIDSKIKSDSIKTTIEADYKSLVSPAGIISKDFILKDPLGISFIALKKLQQLSVGDNFELHNGFILTKDNKNLLLFITPKLATNETDKNTLFIEGIEKIKNNLNLKYKNQVNMSYFGATPVAVANATQIKADVKNTSIFATVTLVLLLAFFYRSLLTPLIIFVPSLFGAIFALAILYFYKGTISAISLGISCILLGETTDYSIYVLTHLRNNKNIKLLYRDITKPLLLCGVTTAISFLCLFFIKSEALQDLGIFAALSVISTSFFSLLLIPILYNAKNKSHETKSNFIDRLGSFSYHKNKFLVATLLILFIISCFTYSKVTFNNDLSALNFMTPELKTAEKKLENIANISSKSIYLATYGNSYAEVIANNNKLFNVLEKDKKKNEILNFSSIGGIVFSEEMQKQKIQEWNNFWDAEKKINLTASLINEGTQFGFKPTTFSSFYELLNKEFMPIPLEDYLKVKSFFLDEYIAKKDGFYTVSTLVKVTNEKRNEFVNQIKTQPNLVVIDRKQMNETFLGTLKNNFKDLVNYSFIAIFLVLFISFRKIELVIVSIIPIILSWIFTTGLMGLFGLQFNVVNIIVCTLVFGIGVDYSIFMTSGLQKAYTFGKIELPTYRTSILLSVATTILGTGVLVFAQHPALKSIAIISIIGIFSAMMITFILQPLVFNFFVDNRVKKGKSPYEIKRLIHSSLSFTYYGLGGFILSIVSVIAMKILPFSKKRKLKCFHVLMSKFMQSVLMSYPSIKRKINNPHKETFEKPAIIIANHSSFLDILAIGMLSPKIIFLVSDWVYNSPIFGKGVRLAGFYPVSNGIDNGIEHLKLKIDQGFSLMVFPEGTRSEDNTIKRFHKGAFYLAEQLNLDIIPIVIHGYSEVLPKNDFIINGGTTTVSILERITPTNTSFGIDYSERTKQISSFFKDRYKQMRQELEGPDYFKKIILNSFDFKETAIIQHCQTDIENSLLCYHTLNNYINSKAKILHFAEDYGQLDLLLSLQEPQRKITTFIENETHRAVAKTNYILKKRPILYLENLEGIQNSTYDTILISDQNQLALENIITLTQHVILVKTPNLKSRFLDLGFIIEKEEELFTSLTKSNP